MRNINWVNPINYNHPLNHGLVSWWLSTPYGSNGSVFRDLAKFKDGDLVNTDIATVRETPLGRQRAFGSLNLDGTNDFVNLNGNDLATGSQNRTVTAWIRQESLASNNMIFLIGTDATDDIWRFLVNSSDGFMRVAIQGSFSATSLSPGLGDWRFVALVLDGTTLGDHTFYLDEQSESSSGAATLNTGSTVAVIGANEDAITGSFQAMFHGQMDDIRFYDRALSPVEIQKYRQIGMTGYPGVLRRRGRVGKAVAAVPAATLIQRTLVGVGV